MEFDCSVGEDENNSDCAEGEKPQDDATAFCNRYDGVLRYWSHPPSWPTDPPFLTAVAWWTWDRSE